MLWEHNFLRTSEFPIEDNKWSLAVFIYKQKKISNFVDFLATACENNSVPRNGCQSWIGFSVFYSVKPKWGKTEIALWILFSPTAGIAVMLFF